MNLCVDVPLGGKNKSKVYLKAYLNHVNAEIGRRFRSAVIICPGGAYAFRSDTEGEYVAVKYQSCGLQAFVLEYSVNTAFPQQMLELAAAVVYIREHADVLDIDPKKVFVCGFSAGGHLAASLAVMWDSDKMRVCYPDTKWTRPSGVILCYPVISAGKFAHKETVERAAGDMDEEERETLSLEKQVSFHMPPVFIWHTLEDQEVPVENTLLFVQALQRYGNTFEVHIFPHGGHGMSLATEYTAVSEDHISETVARWFDMSIAWIREVC